MSDRPFLGTGWGFPPRFAESGASVEMVSGAEDVHQSLQILFTTQRGERVMHDDYGCDLHSCMFEELDQGLVNDLTTLISNAILYHEPRIKMERLDVSASESEPGLLLISMEYTIRRTNSRYNMVYPFYIYEAAV